MATCLMPFFHFHAYKHNPSEEWPFFSDERALTPKVVAYVLHNAIEFKLKDPRILGGYVTRHTLAYLYTGLRQ